MVDSSVGSVAVSLADLRARLASHKTEKKRRKSQAESLPQRRKRFARKLIPVLLGRKPVSINDLVEWSKAEKLGDDGLGYSRSMVTKTLGGGWSNDSGMGIVPSSGFVMPTKDNAMLCYQQLDDVEVEELLAEMGATGDEFAAAIEALP